MPLPHDLLIPDSARAQSPGSTAFFGRRWALGLPAALLLLFGLTVITRSLLSDSPSKVETVVQQPVTPEISAAAGNQRAEVSAPDPGDNLP